MTRSLIVGVLLLVLGWGSASASGSPAAPSESYSRLASASARAAQLAATEASTVGGPRITVAASPSRLATMYLERADTLIVRSSPSARPDLDALTTDMKIMARIIEKKLDDAESLRWPGSIRSVYLEGYGAVFLIRAPFLLTPPPQPEPSANRSADRVWEETVREMMGIDAVDDQPRPVYDAARVDRLKAALTDVLRHATNIRGLEPQERITIVVVSDDAGDQEAMALQFLRGVATVARSRPRGSSVLLISATKSDVDSDAGSIGSKATVVVRARQTSPTREEIEVMGRILEKAADGAIEDPASYGPDLFGGSEELFALSGGVIGSMRTRVRGVYLDGYGALFLMAVRFPLNPPASATATEGGKPSLWEETRQELMSPPDELDIGIGARALRARVLRVKSRPQPYNAEVVGRLQHTLVGALKHAAHAKSIAPDEFVTVAVWTTADKTLMTIRTKKSEIDAVAKGTIAEDEFARRVEVLTY